MKIKDMRNNLGVKTSREEISMSNEGDAVARKTRMVAREGRGLPEVA
jgi:hypothetical protein